MRRAPAIVLDNETREQLEQLVRSRSQPLRLVQRSRIVLLAAGGWDNDAIGAELNITRQKAGRWRSRFAERGMDGILKEEPGRGRPRSIGARKRAARTSTTVDGVANQACPTQGRFGGTGRQVSAGSAK